MAQVFLAVGAAVSKAGAFLFGTGAGAGAGAAAGAASTAATAGKGILTLSKALSVGSALMAVGQGIAANNQAKTEAAFANTQADQEVAAGAARARDLSREYAELRSEQSVIQLANGLDIGIGTPMNVADATRRTADRNLSTTRQNAQYRAASARLRGRGLLAEGRASMVNATVRAGQIGLDAFQLTG